jgi:general secretion pathway protein J
MQAPGIWPNKEQGFTLLELIISITMMGIILLIIGTAMRLGLQSVDSGEKRIAALERFRASLNIVEAQIQSQLPVKTQGTADTGSVFYGDSDSMQFPSDFSLWGNQRGYVTVSYKVVQDEFGKQELHLEESGTGIAKRGEVKLFEFFDRIYFDYFYKHPAEEKGSWVEQWQGTDSVPGKIRLHLVNGDKEMSFIIPVKVTSVRGNTVTAPGNTGAANAPGALAGT